LFCGKRTKKRQSLTQDQATATKLTALSTLGSRTLIAADVAFF
jgi:hypothetical protein